MSNVGRMIKKTACASDCQCDGVLDSCTQPSSDPRQNVLIVMSALMLGSMVEGAMGSRGVMYS